MSKVLKIREFDLSIKAVAEDGFFSGYGSVFGEIDSDREIVEPGAFTKSLTELATKDRRLPVLWQHRTDEPLGVYEKVGEDAEGLYVEGRLAIKDVAKAKEVHALMLIKAVSGLSIGYYVREELYDEKAKVNHLLDVELREVSIVTFPANDLARINVVKALLSRGKVPTTREFGAALRELGFSKKQAIEITDHGLKPLPRRDSGGAVKQVTELLGSLTLPKW